MEVHTPGTPGEEPQFTALDARVKLYWRLGGYLTRMPVVAGIGVGIGWLGHGNDLWGRDVMWLAALVGALIGGPILSTILPPIMYRRWGYMLGKRELRLRHGVLVHLDVWVPYFRIQYVELRQGILERSLGLASLVIHTAGPVRAQVVIPGLERAEGEKLRTTFLALVEHEQP